jgi:hypothetical protein
MNKITALKIVKNNKSICILCDEKLSKQELVHCKLNRKNHCESCFDYEIDKGVKICSGCFNVYSAVEYAFNAENKCEFCA